MHKLIAGIALVAGILTMGIPAHSVGNWNEGPVVSCNQVWIDPQSWIQVTFHFSGDINADIKVPYVHGQPNNHNAVADISSLTTKTLFIQGQVYATSNFGFGPTTSGVTKFRIICHIPPITTTTSSSTTSTTIDETTTSTPITSVIQAPSAVVVQPQFTG